jgi:hypothetical protein
MSIYLLGAHLKILRLQFDVFVMLEIVVLHEPD